MPDVEIYTMPFCGYCHRAKALLDRKGVHYTEYDVMTTPSKRQEMQQRAAGATTVPQIFIAGCHIGDSEALMRLDRSGALDRLLGPAGGTAA